MLSKDFKALQTLKSKRRCSLLRGVRFKTCPPCLKTRNIIFAMMPVAQSEIELLASYIPSPLKFKFNLPLLFLLLPCDLWHVEEDVVTFHHHPNDN
jgi:hypothetical protein